MNLLRHLVFGFFAVAFLMGADSAHAQTGSLPSWNDGAAKPAIVDFVARVTREGSTDFVPVPELIATFDNDGTLWTEPPYYFQLAFAIDRINRISENSSRRPMRRTGAAGSSRT